MKDNYAFRSSTFMRALLVLLFMAVSIQWGFAQLNLNVSRGTLGTVIEQIKSQSKYQFFYDDKLAALPVENVKVNNASIEDALNVILKGKDISYKVEDNIVYLSEKSAAPQEGNQQGKERTITGVVSDDMGPLIGVNVLIKGTSNGCITDLDGNFTLTTTETNPVIVFSYIGYTTQEIPVKGNAPINVMMAGDTQQLEEVVVTALGIKRSEKALSYNVQQVNTDAITSNKDANFVNSLSGKVAGVNINASSSGVGGVSKVVMRGTKSIMQSSNALYVIDGVPIFSGRGTAGGKEFDSQGSSEPIADINPEDIESMSVLTGAAAAALYGSEAANGAIVITTKKGKEGKVSLTVSSNTEFTNPFVMPSFQNRYGTGTGGVMSTSGAMSWGAPLSAANNYNYSPRDDYFQTGIVGTESISLSTGTEKNQTYASAAAVNSKGIVPNNKYNRYNFTVRNTTTFLDDKMTLDFGASYILQNDQNMTNQGTYNNPLVGAYLFPRSNDWSDISMYERYDAARKIYTQYWPVGDEGMVMQNPYWINYRNLRQNKKDRYMLNAGLSYKILDWLTVSGRVRLDNSNNDYTEKFYASTNTQLTESSSRGLYGITKTQDKQLYADFLVSINKYFGEDWSLQANVGGSFSDIRSDAMKTRGPIADGGDAFNGEPVGLTNYFAIQNLSASKTQRLQEGWREQTQSLFASAELGYKNTWKDFTWDTGITFSSNKNKILTLADNAINPVTGELFSLSTLNMGGLGDARFLLKEGGSMGDLYSLRDMKRDANGQIFVDQNGTVATEAITDPDKYIKLGSVLPKGNLAWRNNFIWKNFTAGFLISARLGGVVYSRTQAMLDYYGVSEASADARDLGYVLVNGRDKVNPETWYGVVGSGTSVPQYYTYSATNVRLQEVSLGYTIPRKLLNDVCDIKVSLVGRNLWMIYSKAPFDPESVASTDNFYQGIDYFMMPALRNIGFSLSFKF